MSRMMADETFLGEYPGTPRSRRRLTPDEPPTPASAHRVGAVHRRGLKRSSAACQRCRKRKQKCDGKLPVCGPCSNVGALCVPSDRLVIRADPDCECDRLRAQVHHLEEQNSQLEERLRTVQCQRSDTLSDPSIGDNPPSSLPTGSSLDHGSVSTAIEGGYSGRMLLPTFPRLSSSENQASSFLSSPWRIWDGLPTLESLQPSRVTPETILDEDRLELVDIFFTTRWPQFPVLHRPTFMDQHYTPFFRSEPTSKLSPFMINIVCAIGASEKERGNASCRELHQAYFRAAVQSLGDVLSADDLDCIQCLLLLCMYGRTEPQCVNMWYTTGLALRLAIGINLHRKECQAVTNKSLLDTEMAKHIFWSLYTMDRSVSMAMGRPLGIHDSDITLPYPLSLTDDMLLSHSQAGEVPVPFTNLIPDPKDLSTFLHIIQLRRINADIYRNLHSAGETTLSVESLEALRSQSYTRLNEWLVTAPRYINPTCMNQTSEWFQIAYHQAIMNLYRPSHASPPGTVSIDAIRLCADSSISLITNYSSLYAKNRMTYSFVALTSLFMAAVTMLYSLRASPVLRIELTRDVVESNIRMCNKLLRGMANGRVVGDRSAQIITQLGNATLAFFDDPLRLQSDDAGGSEQDEQTQHDRARAGENGLDVEFMSWFGLKSQELPEQPGVGQPTPSIDIPWNDLFNNGFDFPNFYSNLLF